MTWNEETWARLKSCGPFSIQQTDVNAALAEIDRLTAELEELKERNAELNDHGMECSVRAEAAEAKVEEWKDMAYRERDRADEHDSARQSEKERADYAEAKLTQAQGMAKVAQADVDRARAEPLHQALAAEREKVRKLDAICAKFHDGVVGAGRAGAYNAALVEEADDEWLALRDEPEEPKP